MGLIKAAAGAIGGTLAGLGDGFHHESWVVLNIFFGVLHTLFIEVIFGCMAETTPVCAIDGNVFTHTSIVALYNVK